MLNVHSAREPSAVDLTARARIRDAAVGVFGTAGFGAPVRAVAEAAGVSAALVIHHFGSKDRLREVCDEHVLRVIRETKTEAMTAAPAGLIAQLAAVEEHAPLAAYTVQSLLAGAPLAGPFLERMITDAEAYLGAAVESGAVRPSRDPAGRARYLVMANVGTLLLHMRLHPPADGDPGTALRALATVITGPALELYTEGLFTDRRMLDAHLVQDPDPPAGRH